MQLETTRRARQDAQDYRAYVAIVNLEKLRMSFTGRGREHEDLLNLEHLVGERGGWWAREEWMAAVLLALGQQPLRPTRARARERRRRSAEAGDPPPQTWIRGEEDRRPTPLGPRLPCMHYRKASRGARIENLGRGQTTRPSHPCLLTSLRHALHSARDAQDEPFPAQEVRRGSHS